MINAEIAVYKKQKLKIYQGNILIEALPEIRPNNDILEEIAFYPEMDDEPANMSNEERLLAINTIYDIFQPFKMHAGFLEAVNSIIRDGYVPRKPMIKKDTLQSVNQSKFRSVKNCALTGPSGIGKSTSIEKVLSTFNQVIIHPAANIDGTFDNFHQIVWLKIDCPLGGNLKEVYMSIFQAIDNLDIGTRYVDRFTGLPNPRLTTQVADIMRIHHVGMLVIDEIQNLTDLKSNEMKLILDFFVYLNNVSKVPILLIGTPKAKSIFQGDVRHKRRWVNEIKWGRLDYDQYWRLFIEVLWEYSWLKKQPPLTTQFIYELYYESQGIIDAAVTLYKAAQESGIKNGSETFTVDEIKILAKTKLGGFAEVLTALKDKDKDTLLQFGDTTLKTMSDFENEKPKDLPVKKKPRKSDLVEDVVKQLLALDVLENYARANTEEIIKNNPAIAKREIVSKILNSYNKLLKKQKELVVEKKDPALVKFLAGSEESGVPVWELLDEAGESSDPMEEFDMGFEG